MAINKTIPTIFDVDSTHHVVEAITILRSTNKLKVRMSGYKTAAAFNNNKFPFPLDVDIVLSITPLPAALKTAINNLKTELENYLIANETAYIGGTRVKDNGDPVS